MYIKREPLGKGNLTFGKRRKRRYPFIFIIAYLLILAGAMYVFLHKDTLQPKVLAAIGPTATPTLSPDVLVQQGKDEYMAGNLDTAAQYYEQAAEMMPNDIQLLADLSRTLTLINTEESRQQALTVAEQIILIAPEDPRGYAMKARALNWSGDADQSAIEALRAIELDPNYVEGHAYLAEAYTDLGQLQQGRAQAEMAIELDPYNVDARRNYANVLEYYGDYGGAISQYQQALALEPNLLDLWYGVAKNYRAAGQYESAVEAFNQILRRTPQDPLPYVGIGRTYFEVGEHDSAQDYLERAVSLVCEDCPLHTYEELEAMDFKIPQNELPDEVYLPAWQRLGMVYHSRKNYEDAIAIYEELIQWANANDVELPIEAYYISATDYYYLDQTADGEPLCNIAVPRAFEALDMYENERLNEPNALRNILSVIVLCRDYVNTPATINFEFPPGYEEPDVYLERFGVENPNADNGEDNTNGDNSNTDAQSGNQ